MDAVRVDEEKNLGATEIEHAFSQDELHKAHQDGSRIDVGHSSV
jgi:hypothetical protein